MSVTTGTFPGVRIVDMPDLGTVTDSSSVVGEHAGSGRFTAPALRAYMSIPKNIRDFGARGDGVTDDSGAIQAAANAAVAARTSLYIPASSLGYLVNVPINLTNLSGALTIEGDGMIALIFALIDMPPSNGSTLLANTGTGKPVFDCTGSNNIIFRDLNILAIGRPNPSTIGIIFGTSYTAPTPGWPGGSNCAMENVSISLTNAAGSTPMAFIGGSGPAHFFNVWTVGQYGLLFSTNNNTGIASPYVEFGEKLTIDAVVGVGCSLQSWGMHNTLYIEGCDNHTWAQTYMALLDETGTWAGNPYPILLSNVIDIRIDVESDYWPSLFTAYGNIDSVTIRGTVWQSTTPIPANVPVVGLFNGGGSVTNSTFSVKGVIHSLPNHNFYYTTVGGSSPTLNGFNACVFDQYDTTVSPNVFYGDCNSTYSVPFFNVQFSGNFDVAIGTSGPIAFLVNGGGATAAQYRCFVNGIRQGTA